MSEALSRLLVYCSSIHLTSDAVELQPVINVVTENASTTVPV